MSTFLPSSSNFLQIHALFGGVRKMNEVDALLAGLAEEQFGVFARHQASAAGLSEYAISRRAASARWDEMFPNVYRLPGSTRTGRPEITRDGIATRGQAGTSPSEELAPGTRASVRVGRFRLDFAWPSLRVACECDGFEHHGARLAWRRDRRRLAAIEGAGWRILHVTWADVTHEPGLTLDRLTLALLPSV